MYAASPNYSHTTYYSADSTRSTNNDSTTANRSHNDSGINPIMESSIESGPSFTESLQRFKTASGANAQMASWKNSLKMSSSKSSTVQKRVEETRTMITQSSQKSYHIE